jgi:hypothetical protein
MTDVQLEIIDLSTGSSLGKFQLDLCTPKTYELDPGNYQFKATHILTREVQTRNITIVEGVNPQLDFTFSPAEVVYGNTTVGISKGTLANSVIGSIYLCPVNGYAKSITVELVNYGAAWRSRAALFDGDTFEFLGMSDEVIGPFPDGPVTFPISETIPQQANKKYMLAVTAEGDVGLSISPSSLGTYVLAYPYTGTFPTSMSSAGWHNIEPTIYCTVSETAPPPPPTQYTLNITATTGGTTSPSVGTYNYNEGDMVNVTATASSGYSFDHWELDGINIGSVNPTTVTMDTNHTLLAVFAEIPPPPKHTLTVNSTPIQRVPFTIEKVS